MFALRRPRVRAAAMCLMFLSAASAAAAQQRTASAPLTIDDAVREAVAHNLTLLADRYSVDIAQARVLTAQLRPNPVFTYNLMLPDRSAYENNISPRENVFRTDVVFERGGKRDRRIDVAQQARSVAELQLANTMRAIALDVQSAFVDVVLAQENLALARESLRAFDDLVRVNAERVRTGDLSRVELSRSRLAALQFQNDVRQQESKLAIARNRLNTLLGRTAAGPIEVAGELRRDDAPLDVEALRTRALAQRPDLAAMRRDEARSAADVRLQMAEGRGDLTLSGEYHRQQSAGLDGNLYGLYLSVPLPLFNRNQGEIARARQEQKQGEARIRALEAEVAADVQAAYEAYAASRDVVGTVEGQMLSQAREVRTATEYSYRRGEASFVEFLDAVRAFNETMQSYNEARAEYARSLYTLDAATGASVASLVSSKATP